jgi:hypothetical protein
MRQATPNPCRRSGSHTETRASSRDCVILAFACDIDVPLLFWDVFHDSEGGQQSPCQAFPPATLRLVGTMRLGRQGDRTSRISSETTRTAAGRPRHRPPSAPGPQCVQVRPRSGRYGGVRKTDAVASSTQPPAAGKARSPAKRARSHVDRLLERRLERRRSSRNFVRQPDVCVSR